MEQRVLAWRAKFDDFQTFTQRYTGAKPVQVLLYPNR